MNSETHGLITAALLRRVWQGVCARVGPFAGRLRCAARHESGTATVEFCMVFPIVIFLILIPGKHGIVGLFGLRGLALSTLGRFKAETVHKTGAKG